MRDEDASTVRDVVSGPLGDGVTTLVVVINWVVVNNEEVDMVSI